LLFLQRYISLLGLEARGFGPYQTASYLLLLSGDGGSLRAGQAPLGFERVLSLVWPALFFFAALQVLAANNA